METALIIAAGIAALIAGYYLLTDERELSGGVSGGSSRSDSSSDRNETVE